MWSRCAWVSRIASQNRPLSARKSAILDAAAPGSTATANVASSSHTTYAFCANGPDANVSTWSLLMRLCPGDACGAAASAPWRIASCAAAAVRGDRHAARLDRLFLFGRQAPAAGDREHAAQRVFGAAADLLVEHDLVLLVIEGPCELGERVDLHVPADRGPRQRDDGLLREALLQSIDQPALRSDDQRVVALRDLAHRGRGDHEVGAREEVTPGLRVNHDLRLRVRPLRLVQLLHDHVVVHVAVPFPGDDLTRVTGVLRAGCGAEGATASLGDILREVAVGYEDDGAIPVDRLDDLHRVGAGAADVALRLDLRRRVHVGHDGGGRVLR